MHNNYSVVFAVLLLGCIAVAEGRKITKNGQCACGPYNEKRTPDEVCSSTLTDGSFCNTGGYFPVPGCSKFFTCGSDGKAIFVECPAGTLFDVQTNTCNWLKLEMNGETVWSTPCSGFLYAPKKNGCYNDPSTNSGKGAWGLYNTGENSVGCGNTGTASSGVRNTGTFSAGCENTGTASWGNHVSGGGSWGDNVTEGNHIGK